MISNKKFFGEHNNLAKENLAKENLAKDNLAKENLAKEHLAKETSITEKMVLISSDQKRLKIDIKSAKKSKILREMIENLENDETEILIPNFNHKILENITKWCK